MNRLPTNGSKMPSVDSPRRFLFPVVYPILERQQALGLDALDVNILLHLARYWWVHDNAPHPSKTSIAKAINVDPRTVQRRIAAMEKGGLIRRELRKTSNNTNRTNRYHFDGLVDEATPYAKERLQERTRRQKEDAERVARKGRPRLSVVSDDDN